MKKLDVITVIANPSRYKSRYRLYSEFAQHMERAGARLTTVEAAFWDRPFEITQAGNPRHVQVHIHDELWHKESLINLGLARLPDDAEYVAWIDADIEFRHHHWAEETVEYLQHYEIVQMFSHAVDLGPERLGAPVVQLHTGFVYSYLNNRPFGNGYEFWHPGFAWAANRSALDKMEGLIDWTLLGAADHIMALALIGRVDQSMASGLHQNYYAMAHRWQYLAEQQLKRDIGFVPGTVFHQWHGKKADRGYVDRWKILQRHGYDPASDIMRDCKRVLRLAGNKPGLRDDLRRYFLARNEDSEEL